VRACDANERSQAALDVIRLTCSKAAAWTVDVVARMVEFLKLKTTIFFIYLFLPSVTYNPEGRQKLDWSQNSKKTLLYCIYLFII